MDQQQLTRALGKALEVWTLQNLCDIAILAGFAALALIAGRAYFESIKERLTLRAVREVFDSGADLGVDILLAFVALVAVFVTNMDIMADIKIGLPFVPVAFLLKTAALVIRLFHGGRAVGSPAWVVALALLGLACLFNWVGFTFVMEGAGDEYLELHPSASALWKGLEHLRSNKNPNLAMATFVSVGPALLVVYGWAVIAGAVRAAEWAKQRADEAESEPETDEAEVS